MVRAYTFSGMENNDNCEDTDYDKSHQLQQRGSLRCRISACAEYIKKLLGAYPDNHGGDCGIDIFFHCDIDYAAISSALYRICEQ